jgi:hypothetical protein
MKVLDKKGFKLPYVDSATYRELMRLGLRYDKAQRSYSAEELGSEGEAVVLGVLSKILHEEVSFGQTAGKAPFVKVVQTCVFCGKKFPCDECRYFELCETRDVSSSCVCGKCLEEGKAAL